MENENAPFNNDQGERDLRIEDSHLKNMLNIGCLTAICI